MPRVPALFFSTQVALNSRKVDPSLRYLNREPIGCDDQHLEVVAASNVTCHYLGPGDEKQNISEDLKETT